ncbi:hypothetical protein BofuT4_uP109040.1 [Botrytis cinerea T4]|uniref:Uncharacterized protein n=1 Tax=Botryotinia fuckeliana (strain T4) TaxID=999810 RepID=G2Y7B8_BOTF4|nr:hypothetical protein BofuT4_uP109040.1 [Botrytis cinerea T4]
MKSECGPQTKKEELIPNKPTTLLEEHGRQCRPDVPRLAVGPGLMLQESWGFEKQDKISTCGR